ncbi:MAG: hypothetical protein L0Y64_19165 [Myxococcaceae bacterium]|nr:hypothetical protein [Myxococcaceae bacterium]
MTVLELVTDPHEELQHLLEQFQKADDAKQRRLFLRIADLLVACPEMGRAFPRAATPAPRAG